MGLGRALILFGLLIAAIGVLLSLGPRLPLRIGRLPGDFHLRGRNWSIYFPLATSLLLSAVVTLVLHLLAGRRR